MQGSRVPPVISRSDSSRNTWNVCSAPWLAENTSSPHTSWLQKAARKGEQKPFLPFCGKLEHAILENGKNWSATKLRNSREHKCQEESPSKNYMQFAQHLLKVNRASMSLTHSSTHKSGNRYRYIAWRLGNLAINPQQSLRCSDPERLSCRAAVFSWAMKNKSIRFYQSIWRVYLSLSHFPIPYWIYWLKDIPRMGCDNPYQMQGHHPL